MMMWKSISWAIVAATMIIGAAHAEKTNACQMLIAFARIDGKCVKKEKIQSYLQSCNALGGKGCELARKRLADYGVPDPGFACQG
jgi:hypothetical protein